MRVNNPRVTRSPTHEPHYMALHFEVGMFSNQKHVPYTLALYRLTNVLRKYNAKFQKYSV